LIVFANKRFQNVLENVGILGGAVPGPSRSNVAQTVLDGFPACCENSG